MTNPLSDEVIDKAVELLPCPFCGSNSFIFLRVDRNNYALICQYTTSHGCGMRGPYGKSRKEAGIRWNTRAAAKVIESALAGDRQSKTLPKIPGHIPLLSLHELHDWLDARSRCEDGISRAGCDLAVRSLKAAIKGKSHG